MFKKQKFSKDQIVLISEIHDIFARLAIRSLSTMLRSSMHMQVASVKQMSYGSYISSITAPSTLAIIDMGTLKGSLILEIDSAASYSIIDRVCGSTRGRTKVLRELTDIAVSLIEGIITRVMGDMREAWSLAIDINPSLKKITVNPMFVKIANPADMAAIISLETIVGDVKGNINICVPYFNIGLYMDKPSEKQVNKTTSVEDNKPENKEKVPANLADDIKKLRQDFSEFRDDLVSKITSLLEENRNFSEEKAAGQIQSQRFDAWKLDTQETDTIKLFSSAVKDNAELVAEFIRLYLYQGDRSKAAVFFIALGSELSIEIFKHLREDELETLTFEIARMEMIDFKEKAAVLREFHELYTANKNPSIGGIDYVRVLLEESVGAQKAIDIINRLTASLQVRPFYFIRQADPVHVINIIKQEHPQIAAFILAYLETDKASIILQNLPLEMQSDIAIRIACLDRTRWEVVCEVERALEKKLSTLASGDYTAAGGVESIADILSLVDHSSERQILKNLEGEDPELVQKIIERLYIFEDIIMILSDRAIQKFLRDVDSQELAKFLKIEKPEVQDKIFRNMSKRAAGMLKEDIEYIYKDQVLLKDIEMIRYKFISIIRRLEEAGEIVIPRGEAVVGPYEATSEATGTDDLDLDPEKID